MPQIDSPRRGSRKHVLDWTEQPAFRHELEALVGIARVDLTRATFMPRGHEQPDEARLETFGPAVMPGHRAWAELTCWWLAHPVRANTPNWDIASTAWIEGRPGLVLVEAKANVPELGTAGKPLAPNASARSLENHRRIASALLEAEQAWQAKAPAATLTIDSHYQLANRLAFTWKLASLGIPTVLVYLGFTGDEGIADAGEPLRDAAHWESIFISHANSSGIVPLLGQTVDFGPAAAWVVCRHRPVLELSPLRPRGRGALGAE